MAPRLSGTVVESPHGQHRATVVEWTAPDGDASIDTTVQKPMCEFIAQDSEHPCIVALARRLKAGARTTQEAIYNAFAHVVRTIRYKNDPPQYEFVQAPKYLLGCEVPYPGYRQEGDCDCMTTALGAILAAMGIEPLIRVVAWRKRDYTHVNARVQLPSGEMLALDPVMKRDGFGGEKHARFREKVYRCPMKKNQAFSDGNERGLSGCGCGGRCGGCGGHQHDDGVIVNVNTGTIDASQRADRHDRTTISRGGYTMRIPDQRVVERREVRTVREVPRILRIPRPVVRPIRHVQQVQTPPQQNKPPMRRIVRKVALPVWKEFT